MNEDLKDKTLNLLTEIGAWLTSLQQGTSAFDVKEAEGFRNALEPVITGLEKEWSDN